METGQACRGGCWQPGRARTGTWGHWLGLSVTEASKGLEYRRLLAAVLLLRQPDIDWTCPLPGRKREELERKTGPISDKESCKLTKINPTSKTPTKKVNPPLFLHHEMHWLDSGLCAGSCGLYCAVKILVANRVNGLIHNLLNWIENLQWALLVLDQTQKKQVRAGQNVLGKIPLWMRVSLTVPIHCNNWNKWCTAPHPSSKACTQCFLHRLPSDVDMTKNRDKMLPNLGAYLKSWFSIVLYYLQAEEIYVTVICYPGTEN